MVAFDVARGEAVVAGAGQAGTTAGGDARRWWRLGIVGKFALLTISFGLVTAVVVSLFLYHSALDFLVQQQQQSQAATLQFADSRVVNQIDGARRDAQFLMQTPAMMGVVRAITNGSSDPVDASPVTLTEGRLGELFRALLSARPNYLSLRFIDQNGHDTVVAERAADGEAVIAPVRDLRSQAQLPYFAQAARLGTGSTYVSDPELLRDEGKLVEPRMLVMHVSAPVLNNAGAFLGVALINIDMRRLFNLISQAVGDGSRVFIADGSGNYLANPDVTRTSGTDLGTSFRLQDDFPAVTPLLDGTMNSYTRAVRHGFGADLFIAQPVAFDSQNPGRRLIVAVQQAVSVPYSELIASSAIIAWVVVLLLLLGGAAALVLLRLLVVPLHRIGRVASDLAAGGRDIEVATLAGRNDEIGDLATSIDVMARAISEREDRLTAQTAELKRSNQDLAQFAYVASHDLQEPLRMVGSYLELLSRRYKGKLDQEADEFIGFAVDGAARMKRLINDLLGYSRAGSTPLKWQRVDVAGVLKNVLASLGARLAETGGKVEVGPMPMITGDASQLERVFQNLIDNALKYHSDAPPAIVVSVASTEAGWRFAVADNGIGIDPRFKEQVFEIFKRLHGRDQYSGTGIGLAVTKLIVERHGGRIWVERGEDGGSVFYFTLPEAGAD